MKQFLVVDDHALMRTGLVLTRQGMETQATVLEAGDIKEALEIIRLHPDLSLVGTDLRLPVIDGLAGLGIMRQLRPQLRVVVIAAHYTESDVQLAIERGAAGFVPKNYSSQQISEVLRLLLDGGVYRPSTNAFSGGACAHGYAVRTRRRRGAPLKGPTC